MEKRYLIRNRRIENAIIRTLEGEDMLSTNGICRTLAKHGATADDVKHSASSFAVRRSLKVLEWEGKIANVGDTVAAWKLA